MKVIKVNIEPFQEVLFFSPIRDKIDYARILIYAARQLLLNISVDGIGTQSHMKLIIDKMSRLFFYTSHKYFSISFPLTVKLNDDKVSILTTYSGRKIDHESISSILSILNSKHFISHPSLIYFYMESDDSESLTGVSLLEEIFLFEPSYIRYDYDLAHENGELHPLHHIDINYSQCSTFKIGIEKKIAPYHFENLQNTCTNCSYLIKL